MDILVYGAGVIGGCLADTLCKTGHSVTVLARGNQKAVLENVGLVAKNHFTKRTSVSYPRVIGALLPTDRYDAIFAVMQFRQMEAILPELAANVSPLVVLVGNNMKSAEMEQYLNEHSAAPKTIVWGFQATGGERVNGHYTYVAFGQPSMTVGSLAPRESWFPTLEKIFAGVKYKLQYQPDMDAWYKAHAAIILPAAYICYKHNCDLRAASNAELHKALDAAYEGLLLLKRAGYAVDQKTIDSVGGKRTGMFLFMWICARTKLGELAVSRHVKNAVGEMIAMSAAFDEIKAAHSEVVMSAWNELERHLPISL